MNYEDEKERIKHEMQQLQNAYNFQMGKLQGQLEMLNKIEGDNSWQSEQDKD